MDTVGYGHTERLEQVIRPERQRAIVPVSLSIHNHRSRKRPVVFLNRRFGWMIGSQEAVATKGASISAFRRSFRRASTVSRGPLAVNTQRSRSRYCARPPRSAGWRSRPPEQSPSTRKPMRAAVCPAICIGYREYQLPRGNSHTDSVAGVSRVE